MGRVVYSLTKWKVQAVEGSKVSRYRWRTEVRRYKSKDKKAGETPALPRSGGRTGYQQREGD